MLGDLVDDDEWIAVNSLNNSNHSKESLLFIVSINEDEQKVTKKRVKQKMNP
jgi:hypothetical protein